MWLIDDGSWFTEDEGSKRSVNFGCGINGRVRFSSSSFCHCDDLLWYQNGFAFSRVWRGFTNERGVRESEANNKSKWEEMGGEKSARPKWDRGSTNKH